MDFWGGWGGGEMVGTDLSDLPNKFKFKGWGIGGRGRHSLRSLNRERYKFGNFLSSFNSFNFKFAGKINMKCRLANILNKHTQ